MALSTDPAPHKDSAAKFRSLSLLMLAEIAVMSLWFLSAAILPEMLSEHAVSETRQAALSSAVQAGFVFGALASAFLGLADRINPARLFAVCALTAAVANLSLLVLTPGGTASILARFLTGAMLAGVYPVGMKIAVGWGKEDRGFLVGTLVGALTFGSASPHLLALLGGADWRLTVIVASAAAAAGGLICLLVRLGPFHAKAGAFDPGTIRASWTNKKVRLAYAGYLGHMWELYAMWAWIGVALTASFSLSVSDGEAVSFARVIAFCAIAAGGVACIFGGLIADRVGKENIAIAAMVVSGVGALATAFTFGGPVWLTALCAIVWGAAILPDSAQFSALVADHASPEKAGSLMTFQTALGFALTFFTVQVTPLMANTFGWPLVFAIMAIGPAYGIIAMLQLKRLTQQAPSPN